jgi:hypothetical protein
LLAAILAAHPGIADCFSTYVHFPESFARYVASNPSPTTGKPPSVAGYAGEGLALYLPFDFDGNIERGKSPELALCDVRALAVRLDGYEALEATRFYFSGSKGFSVDAPSVLFGGFEPGSDVARRLGRLAGTLAAGLETFDRSIYHLTALWRVPNTRHGRSGLYKIPLSAGELVHLSIDEIRKLARSPRSVELPPEHDFDPRPGLVELWKSTATAPASVNRAPRRPWDGPVRPAFAELILPRCAWFRHARDDAPTLSEIDWYAMLSIIGHCVDGERLAHDWSAPYSRYSHRETEKKLRHALADTGPFTCTKIAGQTCGKFCDSCTERANGVRSPITLGWLQGVDGGPRTAESWGALVRDEAAGDLRAARIIELACLARLHGEDPLPLALQWNAQKAKPTSLHTIWESA